MILLPLQASYYHHIIAVCAVASILVQVSIDSLFYVVILTPGFV